MEAMKSTSWRTYLLTNQSWFGVALPGLKARASLVRAMMIEENRRLLDHA